MRKSKVYNTSDEEFQQLIASSLSMSDCCKKIGLSEKGSNGRTQIKKRYQELNIDYMHLSTTHPQDQIHHNKKEYTEILVEHSTYANLSKLKDRLVKDGLLEYKCTSCGNIGIWNEKPLTLQLHHINGIRTDNRLENLTLLCPNCHTQTDNYGSKNFR